MWAENQPAQRALIWSKIVNTHTTDGAGLGEWRASATAADAEFIPIRLRKPRPQDLKELQANGLTAMPGWHWRGC